MLSLSGNVSERRRRGLMLVVVGLRHCWFSPRHGKPPDRGPDASVTVCQVTGSAGAPGFAQVQVSVDQVAAYVNRFPVPSWERAPRAVVA